MRIKVEMALDNNQETVVEITQECLVCHLVLRGALVISQDLVTWHS